MNAKEYLEYLILTKEQFNKGEVGIDVQLAELKTLMEFLKLENKQ